MILEQYFLKALAHASYLIADEGSRVAAVVDPQRDVDRYVDYAASLGLEIRYVILTHTHADFVAGHLELNELTGASVCLGARAEAEYPFTPLADGATVDLGGRVRLEVLETPGHSADSISILVFDLDQSAVEPHAVLTGDTLLIGDVGRPDLRAALGWSADALASLLYDSLRDKLIPLPDATLVYPAHGAGSLCARNLSAETVTTLGQQRRENEALRSMTREEFVRLVTAEQPDPPPYFTYDAVLNTKRRPMLEHVLARALRPLPLDEVVRLAESGEAELLDAREAAAFAAGHLAGSVNIGLEGSFETWVGTLLEPERPIVLVTEPGWEHEAVTRLGRIGFDRVAGYLEGGPQTFARRSDLVRSIERISVEELAAMIAIDGRPAVLDVRADSELSAGSIEGSLNVPLNRLAGRLADIPRDGPVAVLCGGGYRSAIAVSLLSRDGHPGAVDVLGGMSAWYGLMASRTTGDVGTST